MDAVTIPALRNGHRDPSYPTSFPVSPQQRSISSSLIVKRAGIEAVPSLTCRDYGASDQPTIQSATEQGIDNFFVVYGDRYQDPARDRYELPTSAELIRHVAHTANGRGLSIGAATNQYARDREREVSKTLAKVDAGAGFIITNVSFDTELVLEHRDALLSAGLDVPLLIQISIPHSLANLTFVSEKFGISVPPHLKRKLESYTEGAGVEMALESYEKVRFEADGVHFSYLLRRRNPVGVYAALLNRILGDRIARTTVDEQIAPTITHRGVP